MKLLKEPPLFTTEETPDSIMGEQKELYERHFRAWKRNEHDPEKLNKVFNERELDAVGRLNTELLDSGFRPVRINSKNEIVWAIITTGHIRVIKRDGVRIPDKQEVVRKISFLKRSLKA
jgi:hypothetical protein